jgi:5-methylcytosine-specific restriction endonuclease McrA
MRLWNKQEEKLFFIKSKSFASKEQLFYRTDDGRYLAYWPKRYRGRKYSLQARNSLIGNYTEKWVCDLFDSLIDDENLHLVQQARIPSLGITSKSPADVVIATKDKKILKASEIKLICEVKMSVVWNWQYDEELDMLKEAGDYRTHQGKPSFTRSDSILKAIGKCIDIRVSNFESTKIPIIVVGNTPLSNGFSKKADYLKHAGLIQGFWSLNPFPLNHGNTRKSTPKKGFYRFDNTSQLRMHLNQLFERDLNFFSGMESPKNLGKLIEMANKEETYENKGLKFLNLLKRS